MRKLSATKGNLIHYAPPPHPHTQTCTLLGEVNALYGFKNLYTCIEETLVVHYETKYRLSVLTSQ